MANLRQARHARPLALPPPTRQAAPPLALPSPRMLRRSLPLPELAEHPRRPRPDLLERQLVIFGAGQPVPLDELGSTSRFGRLDLELLPAGVDSDLPGFPPCGVGGGGRSSPIENSENSVSNA